jgi:hypothetical protein
MGLAPCRSLGFDLIRQNPQPVAIDGDFTIIRAAFSTCNTTIIPIFEERILMPCGPHRHEQMAGSMSDFVRKVRALKLQGIGNCM